LLNDVSTITRLEDGSSRIECESIDLRAIVDEIASEVALLPDDKRMRMNITLPSPMHVLGNSTLLMSIMKNLTDNAIAYSGGRDIFIRLTEGNDAMHTITFSDNGIGIDEEHINHIFERFYRIDAGRSRKLGGTGLGLSIVKNAVLFHGGDIEVYNRKAGGLEFKFTLPIAEN
jgi:signal transduction histidine kinase